MAPKTPETSWEHGNLGSSHSEQGSLPGSAAAAVLPSNLRLSHIPWFEFSYPVGVEVFKREKRSLQSTLWRVFVLQEVLKILAFVLK